MGRKKKEPELTPRQREEIRYQGVDRLYGVWSNMKQRCTNPKATGYESYGGRGIKVCDEWFDNYKAFREWAFAHGYDQFAPIGQCTIDRIDNDGPYSPNNCQWKTQGENNKNRTRANQEKDTKKEKKKKQPPIGPIEIDGISKTATQWGKESGIPAATIISRYRRGKHGKDLLLQRHRRDPIYGPENGFGTWLPKEFWPPLPHKRTDPPDKPTK